MTFNEEKNPKIVKKDWYLSKENGLRYSSREPSFPQENLLHVFMGGARSLIPNTPEYRQYDGLETGALASCTGFALYVPKDDEAILGVAHLSPSQSIYSVIESFTDQLKAAGINPRQIRQSEGFMDVIPGQTAYDRGKDLLKDKIAQATQEFRKQFPKLRNFPFNKVAYSVLSGHLSSYVKLLKDGRLAILGEGKAY